MAASLLDGASVTLRTLQFRTLRTRAPESRLLRLLDAEIIPRLSRSSHDVEAELAGLAKLVTNSQTPTDPVAQLADLAVSQDQASATELMLALHLSGWPLKALYLELLQPAAQRLGSHWEQDRCSFIDVSLGTAFLQRVLREFSLLHDTASPVPGHHHRILLLPAPGEQHIFGISMLGEFFRDAGWDVCGGPRINAQQAQRLVNQEQFDAVGFSAATSRALEPLHREIERIRSSSRNRRLQVLIGGNAISNSVATMRQLGADATASDAASAVESALTAVRAASALGSAR